VRTRRLAPLLVAAALAVPLVPTAGSLAAQPGVTRSSVPPKSPLVLEVLSNRADLVSGGDALVRVRLPKGVDPKSVDVFLGDRDITQRFRVRRNGQFEGLVEQLKVGANVVSAAAPGYFADTVITNHPNGGPVFSGPQLQPYQCQDGALDARCNEPATYELLYKSSDPTKTGLQPYDPDNPPSDVATTTTDEGIEVPFIVRQEKGFQDRDRYTILQLWQPGKKWAPWKAQKQWNHKVLITHGGGCGASYAPGNPPLEDYAGTVPTIPGYEQSYVTALGQGFAVMSTALDNTGHNCNLAMQAESLVMAKERLVEQYGPIRYTIGTGCSGGSIAQHTIANAYPGIYQGLVTTCSYPDVLTAGAQFADYHLLRLYFEHPDRWAPDSPWTPQQMAEVEGHASHVNAVTADEGLFKSAINPEDPCPGTKDPAAGDESTRYDSETNPGGVRCSILDIMVNLLGRRPKSVWSEWEKAAGHGFAGLPFSNVGVQYGLDALLNGKITPSQFVDLNEKVGGLDINADPSTVRIQGDPASITNVYRTGLVNEANHLDQVAIINHGGPDPGAAHDYSHAWWTEERLLADQGHTDNRVMWFGTTPLIGDPGWANDALLEMDRWLSGVEKDKRSVPLSQKVVEDKPADLTDRCEVAPEGDLEGIPGAEDVCHTREFQTHYGTPRQVAGGPSSNDKVACRLQPLDRDSYLVKVAGQETPVPIVFTDDQWARLEAVFSQGVCDWTKPGKGQGPAETWLRYGKADGGVAYGGRPLPGVPAHSGTGWSSRPFRSLLNQ
jgi:hypothetical protein